MAHNFTGKALVQLQEAIRTEFAVPVVWFTCHAIGTGPGNQPVQIRAAPPWGLMRTAQSEHPELCLRLIDVDGETDLATLNLALMLGDHT